MCHVIISQSQRPQRWISRGLEFPKPNLTLENLTNEDLILSMEPDPRNVDQKIENTDMRTWDKQHVSVSICVCQSIKIHELVYSFGFVSQKASTLILSQLLFIDETYKSDGYHRPDRN